MALSIKIDVCYVERTKYCKLDQWLQLADIAFGI